jgi:hypothetical protein
VRVKGLDAAGVAEVVSVSRFGPDALNLVFRVDGRVGERLVYRGEESAFEIVEVGRAYAFDADGGLLRLASEAYRIRLAHLFDPYLAVSASQIEALPHQITAVYGEMLPRQPLRFLLADDPGAGKMIMAGLLIKELMIRGDLERCLIVAPGGLVEQWQDELAEKFGLAFDILTRDQIEASITGNPFVEKHRLILRPRRQVAPARIHSRRTDHAGPGDRLTPEDPDLHRAQGHAGVPAPEDHVAGGRPCLRRRHPRRNRARGAPRGYRRLQFRSGRARHDRQRRRRRGVNAARLVDQSIKSALLDFSLAACSTGTLFSARRF